MSKSDTNKKTILVVDDSTIYLEMVSVMIGDEYNLEFATNGQKALHILKNEKDISLIILALQMPYMSGVELLMEAKKDPEIDDIPVIVLTNEDDNEAACLSLGAVDFIKKKPFPMRSVVLDKVEKALNSKVGTNEVDLDSYINALFSEYSTVYLIDAEDYSFDSFTEDDNYRSLNLAQDGPNFFDFINSAIKKYVCDEDSGKLLKEFNRETFMDTMRNQKGIVANFGLRVDGEVLHYCMKAMLVPDKTPQVIIGITNTEETFVGMEALYTFRDDERNKPIVSESLASDYICIYLVHLESNRFVEYSSIPEFSALRLAKSGENFFTFGLKSFIEGVNSVDTERVTRHFTRENVLKAIEEHKAFYLSFRLTFEDYDMNVSVKATKMVNNGAEYLVVGVSNIGDQFKDIRG